ncbi:DUF4926 domain-containing protein [Spirulina sp. CS-785/01]|uniref:DUF4926 domain-containing protein n=1 Tax=Spirulina sp. CS-785/01 TaxID=3021716 RepID=UPI0023312B5A|nr:DUF4926 domain-containing protein [Spirulina sp. CS-785/01]MDB9312518.1 DUF4926 domain-containing protein [Spirulina sp. CS-785/01]
MKFPLFTPVTLKEDLPEYHLKKGDSGIIVEYYPMPDGQEDGYSIEGFDSPQITVEVGESKLETNSQTKPSPPPTPQVLNQ